MFVIGAVIDIILLVWLGLTSIVLHNIDVDPLAMTDVIQNTSIGIIKM